MSSNLQDDDQGSTTNLPHLRLDPARSTSAVLHRSTQCGSHLCWCGSGVDHTGTDKRGRILFPLLANEGCPSSYRNIKNLEQSSVRYFCPSMQYPPS